LGQTIAEGINNFGEIVGYYYGPQSAPANGFLYSGGNY
jgi:hypothetical protein